MCVLYSFLVSFYMKRSDMVPKENVLGQLQTLLFEYVSDLATEPSQEHLYVFPVESCPSNQQT